VTGTLLDCGRFQLDWSRPRIMGIVNVTDDSFSGDGLRGRAADAVAHGLRMIDEGADMLDLGAESSRPGAEPVPADQELDRLLPVLEGLRGCGVPLSVDTVKPEVMRAAIAAGADMINDIAALRAPDALAAVADNRVAVCLMHMQGQPQTMQQAPSYTDVLADVDRFLLERVASCLAAGIARERIVIDPGFGFGKSLEHNLGLLRGLPAFCRLGLPVLVGLSRKSMIGAITGRPVGERACASAMAAALAVQRGARLVRVHDVAATRDALAVLAAVERDS
jgi:dihydropteroate synthase